MEVRGAWSQGLTAGWQDMRRPGSQIALLPQRRGTHVSPVPQGCLFCRKSAERPGLPPPAMKTVPPQEALQRPALVMAALREQNYYVRVSRESKEGDTFARFATEKC